MPNEKNNLTKIREKLLEEDFLKKMKETLRIIISQALVHQARDFSRALEEMVGKVPDFRDSFPQLFLAYKNIIGQAKWMALLCLRKDEVRKLFSDYFTSLFLFDPQDYPYISKLKSLFAKELFIEDRDRFKKEIREILENNQEEITSLPLEEKVGEKQPPTIANWLKEYRTYVGIQRASQLKQTEYLSKSPSVKKLSPEEKEKIKWLISIYEYLKTPSIEPEAFEDKPTYVLDGELRILSDGVIMKVPPEIDRLVDEIFRRDRELIEKEMTSTLSLEKSSIKPSPPPITPFEKKYLEEEEEEEK